MTVSKPIEEQELLSLLKAGNESVLEFIYLKYFTSLSYYAFKLLDDAEAAKDIVSDLLIWVASQPKTFDSEYHLKNYLFLATRHASLRLLGQLKKEQATYDELGQLTELFAGQSDVEQVRATVIAAIYEQVELLPKGCAEVFKLIYFEGRSSNEVAEMLGISVKTVLNQKLNAAKILKAALLKQGLLAVFIAIWGKL
ncbi:RNA polymerase sigma-70 factor, ECF subfamily [Chitinophaga jiangningensis]|uniref:RNA polymerase sigma-70 factor, ECF subfamily n=1 Tax=Chitinophaga jiangningensis TaxID=1419482 RepID=A0A1M7K883_9BACT|nr:sigma-70 family RNA polymerase sigma factor [Chitinophaga jiangningensis]SHM61512.1 RNA polymerase sigma-70 factor, ECF subfamily [Chitinophaga jiangningensis]